MGVDDDVDPDAGFTFTFTFTFEIAPAPDDPFLSTAPGTPDPTLLFTLRLLLLLLSVLSDVIVIEWWSYGGTPECDDDDTISRSRSRSRSCFPSGGCSERDEPDQRMGRKGKGWGWGRGGDLLGSAGMVQLDYY